MKLFFYLHFLWERGCLLLLLIFLLLFSENQESFILQQIIIPKTRDYSQLQDLEVRPVKMLTHVAKGTFWVWESEGSWDWRLCWLIWVDLRSLQGPYKQSRRVRVRDRFEDAVLTALTMEVTMSPGVQVASRSWTRQGIDAPQTLWKECSLCWHLDFRSSNFRTSVLF